MEQLDYQYKLELELEWLQIRMYKLEELQRGYADW